MVAGAWMASDVLNPEPKTFLLVGPLKKIKRREEKNLAYIAALPLKQDQIGERSFTISVAAQALKSRLQ